LKRITGEGTIMRITIVGGGLMSRAIIHDMLTYQDLKDITVLERDPKNIQILKGMFSGHNTIRFLQGDIIDTPWLKESIKESRIVVCAVPYQFNVYVLEMAIKAKAHFIDLGGNAEVIQWQFKLHDRARRAESTAIPACGLAPGTLSILVMRGVEQLKRVRAVRMYCGGLPQNPAPPLDYQLVFSPEGLINEYVEPALMIKDGEVITVPSLSGLETFRSEPLSEDLEAFYTSGNTGTLIQSLKGKVEQMTYKTIRCAGHRDKAKLLIDLGFGSTELLGIGETLRKEVSTGLTTLTPRAILEKLMKENLPSDGPDFVIGKAVIEGSKGKRELAYKYSFLDYSDEETGLSAMSRCTGFSAAIVAGMLARGEVAKKGVVPIEKVISPSQYIEELNLRGIEVKEEVVEI
jgi:lysine 6-dehydrogenase